MNKITQFLQLTDRSEAYHRLAMHFLRGTEELRNSIRAQWDFGAKWIYPNPRRLACHKDERYSCEERIKSILIYDAIEDFKNEDIRDKLLTWAIVYHSCHILKISPEIQFNQIALISMPKTAQAMLDFIGRPEEDKSMNAFMLVEKRDSNGEIEILTSWDAFQESNSE